MDKNGIRTALLPGLLLTSVIASAGDWDASGNLSAGAGIGYSTGKYGTSQTTSMWTLRFKASYETNNYVFDASVPFLEQTGPAGRIVGPGVPGRSRQRGSNVTNSGLGDMNASVTRYLVQSSASGVFWDIGAVVKLDTGDVHKGLGTGAKDYSLQTDLTKSIDRIMLTGTLGHSWLGSPGTVVVNGVQQDLHFNDVSYGAVDASCRVDKQTRAGLTYFQQQPIEAGGSQQRDLTGHLSLKARENRRLRLYLLKGLDDGSPDHAVGVSLTVLF